MIIRIMTTLRLTDRSVRDELLLLRQYRADLGHHPDPDQHVDAKGPGSSTGSTSRSSGTNLIPTWPWED